AGAADHFHHHHSGHQSRGTIDLPHASNAPVPPTPDTIQVGVDRDGLYYWNGRAVEASELDVRLQGVAGGQPQAGIHIQGDAAARYEKIAWILSRAQQRGIRSVSFITRPDNL
ncbi:MAG: biopolymer transporter ExbD, partial [Rhodocyclaceae bacterium]